MPQFSDRYSYAFEYRIWLSGHLFHLSGAAAAPGVTQDHTDDPASAPAP